MRNENVHAGLGLDYLSFPMKAETNDRNDKEARPLGYDELAAIMASNAPVPSS